MDAACIHHMALSAGLAACAAEVLTLPIDTAKVRMQILTKSTMNVTQVSKGFIPTLMQMSRTEGISSWWKGLPAGLHRQMLYATLRLSMYPHLRDQTRKLPILTHVPDLGVKLIAGMSSGAIGMTIANPTELVKVRLQSAITAQGMASANHSTYTGALNAYKTIIKEEGVRGLWRGLSPNIMRNMIVCAAEMVAYDEIKRMSLLWIPDGFLCHCTAGFGAGFMATVAGSPVDVIKTRYMNARPGQYTGLANCIHMLTQEFGFRGFYKGFAPNLLRLGSFNLLVFVFYERLLNYSKSLGKSNLRN